MDCAVTEQCRAANFKTEFTVSVEFWAADKFHYTRAADTVRILSLFHFCVKKLTIFTPKKSPTFPLEKLTTFLMHLSGMYVVLVLVCPMNKFPQSTSVGSHVYQRFPRV